MEECQDLSEKHMAAVCHADHPGGLYDPFQYKPMLGVVVAFKKFNVFQGIWNSPWIGLANFQEAFSSRDFWSALANTLILNIGDLIIGFPIPIFLAIFLNELKSSAVRKTTQTLLYLPNFLSWVIIAGISKHAI